MVHAVDNWQFAGKRVVWKIIHAVEYRLLGRNGSMACWQIVHAVDYSCKIHSESSALQIALPMERPGRAWTSQAFNFSAGAPPYSGRFTGRTASSSEMGNCGPMLIGYDAA
jgi:hypothetical protein